MSGSSGTPATINAVIQFSGATGATWSNLTTPVPNGLITIESDTKVMKRGDGVTLYANLPVFFDLNSLITLMGNTVHKDSALAVTGDLVAGLHLFAINAAGVAVTLTAQQLLTWMIASTAVKSVSGVLNVGP